MKAILLKYANHLPCLRIALALAWLIQVPTFAQGTVNYLVIGPETTEGNYTSAEPFGGATMRIQQFYGKDGFAALSPIINIVSIAFRVEGNDIVGYLQETFNNVTVSLSTSSGTITPSFSLNRGPDYSTVFSGPITFNAPRSPGPAPFDIVIPFNKGFQYDRTAGDLLLELSQDRSTGGPGQLDAFTSGWPLLWGQISEDQVASRAPVTLVTRFGYTPVPEPNGLFLLGLVSLIVIKLFFRRN